MISTEALDQFRQIIREDYGREIDDVEAMRLANDYLAALEAVVSPPREDLTTATKKRENDD